MNSVKTLHQTVAAVQDGRHIEIEQSIVYPDKRGPDHEDAAGESAALRGNSGTTLSRSLEGRPKSFRSRSESLSGCGSEA